MYPLSELKPDKNLSLHKFRFKNSGFLTLWGVRDSGYDPAATSKADTTIRIQVLDKDPGPKNRYTIQYHLLPEKF